MYLDTQKGKFIVLEGGDGAGKSTCMQYVREVFGEERFVYTREPGGTALGTSIRQILLMGEAMDPVTEMLLFFASRVEHIARIIGPALKEGKHVLCDRFVLSSYAYQIVGRQRDELTGLYNDLYNHTVLPFVTPYYIYLDVEPETALKRVVGEDGGKKTRFDNEAYAFHARVREGYHACLATMPNDMYTTITRTGRLSYEEVGEMVIRVIQKVIGSDTHT